MSIFYALLAFQPSKTCRNKQENMYIKTTRSSLKKKENHTNLQNANLRDERDEKSFKKWGKKVLGYVSDISLVKLQ